MYKFIRFFSLTLLLPTYSLIAQNGSLKGKLHTSDQQPAEFVNVGLKGSVKGTSSNAKGEYELNDISPGTYTLVVSFSGLETKEQTVEIRSGETLEVPEITLTENSKQLQEVTITGVQNLNDRPVSIGKIAIKPMDLPQSISSIDRSVLEQQQTQNMSDVLKNFNGVYIMGTTGGVQQEIAARGFAFSSNNTFKNGVRYNNAIMPETGSLERVEVLKGSAAILFGNVSAGGVINLITKKPSHLTGAEVTMQMGSYGFYKPALDVYGTFDKKKKVAFRLNTIYENAGSFRDQVNSERFYINPSFDIQLGKKTELLIEGDYMKDKRTSDFGVGSINYELIDVPRSQFLGAAWSYYNTEQKSLTGTITHRLNSKWQVRGVLGTQQFANDLFGTTRPNSNSSFIREDGKWVRGVQRIQIDEQYYIAQLDLSGKFSTGKINHNVLIGSDADRYATDNTAFTIINRYDSINVFNMDLYTQRTDRPDLSKRITTSTPVQRAGFYVQDLVDLSAKIKFLAGARVSYLQTGSQVFTHATNSTVSTEQVNIATTPRFGLVYQPTKKLSLFGSFANSFAPNTGVDRNGNALDPSFFTQYEAGLKSNLFKDALSANLTAYQIVNSNLAQTDLSNGNTNTNIKELAGEVTSKGLELDVMSRSFFGIMIVAGYSFNDTRYTKSNTYVEGSALRYNPRHTANASAYYSVKQGDLKGLNFGLSYLYFGDRYAGRSTRVTVPNDPYQLIFLSAYELLDASLGYSKRNLTLRLRVSNVLDALSYNVHDDNSVNPIAPRQVLTTISYKF